ncbi:MAG: SprB repeat-containing protein, partial [Flavobacteriales bacterium]|nr:SprB repeat-containing protein [Flavobacteriales bacterium]
MNVLPTVSIANLDPTYCVDGASAALTGSPAGGIFSGLGISGNNFFPAFADTGSHSITYAYTDGNSCSNSVSQNTVVLPLPTVSFTGLSTNYCASNPPITLTGSPTGGTFSGPGISGSSFNPAIAGVGTHNIKYLFSDGNGCSDSASQNVVVNTDSPFLSVDSVMSTEAACDSTCGAIAQVVGSGGVLPYSYAWSTGATGAVATNLCASTYFVTVTDGNGCMANNDLIVAGPNGFTSSIIDTTMVAGCAGACNGTAEVAGNGGVPPYTFSWVDTSNISLGVSTATIASLCANAYYGIVKDANNCVTTAPFTITEPGSLVASTCAQQEISCNGSCDGTATACLIGGTGPFTYLWNDPGAQTTATAIGLCAGTFKVDITDSQGCTSSDSSVVIVEPAVVAATISSTTNANCDTLTPIGSATVNGSGGVGPYLYAWDTGPPQTDSVADGQYAGAYNVTVTDQNGCEATTVATITDTSNMSASITSLTLSSCGGACDGSATVTATGSITPYTYDWVDAVPNSIGETTATADSLCSGVYRAIVTSNVQCIRSVPANTVTPLPLVSFTGLSSAVCESNAAETLLGSPGGGVFSGPGVSGITFDPAIAGVGTHQVKYVYDDGFGCVDSSTQSVTVNALPNVLFVGLGADYCVDGAPSALAAVPPGGIFSGPGISSTVFDPAIAGVGTHTISYTFTNTSGCISGTSQTVIVNALPTVSIVGLNPIYCVDAPATILSGVPIIGSFSGKGISGTSFYPSVADTGTHLIYYLATDGNGCTNSRTDTVQVTPIPIVSFTGLGTTICEAGPADTLVGSPSGGTFSGLGVAGNFFLPAIAGAGVHTVMYTYSDGVGCTDSVTQIIEVLAQPNVGIAGFDSSAYCIDAVPVTLTGFPSGGVFTGAGMTGSIFDPAVADTGVHSITYTFTDGNGCIKDTIQVVTIYPVPVAIATSVTDTTCAGSIVDLTSTPGTSYTWFKDSILLPGSDTMIYQTNSANLGGTYSYYVRVMDSNGCSANSAPISLTVDDNVFTFNMSTTASCAGLTSGTATAIITGGLAPYTYLWNDGSLQTTVTAV